MAHYVDGFVVPIPLRNVDAYRRMSEKCGKVWLDHGALDFWESIGDEEKVTPVKVIVTGLEACIARGETCDTALPGG